MKIRVQSMWSECDDNVMLMMDDDVMKKKQKGVKP